MAYDKVVDSTQLEAAITATANAIREKTGDAALIQWLADKGFAEAVAAIQAGGVKMARGTFTPTSNTSDRQTLVHNLGVIPNVIMIFPEKPIVSDPSSQVAFIVVVSFDVEDPSKTFGSMAYLRANTTTLYKNEYFAPIYSYEKKELTGNSGGTGIPICSVDDVKFDARPNLSPTSATTRYFLAGVTYHWVAAYVDFGDIGDIVDDVGGLAV